MTSFLFYNGRKEAQKKIFIKASFRLIVFVLVSFLGSQRKPKGSPLEYFHSNRYLI